jgi:membrane-associated phospholipid phosphatase
MRTSALLVAGGLVALVVTALPVEATAVPAWERRAFRAVNDVPSLPFPPVWAVMQLGMVLVVPAAALVALAYRRPRLAVALLVAGALAYGGGKLVKQVVERGRPADLLADVQIRGAASEGLGFVSGHAAVAAALATVLLAHVGGRVRWVLVVLAALVGLGRVYVGAHLPLDVIGGAALGVAAGGVGRATCS